MSAPTKTRKPRTTAPAFDYSALTAVDTEPVSRGGSPAVLSTPFPKWMAESLKTGKAKQITVPKANRGSTLTLIRAAASLADHGVKTSSVDKGANTVITFQAKAEKRAYNGRKSAK